MVGEGCVVGLVEGLQKKPTDAGLSRPPGGLNDIGR